MPIYGYRCEKCGNELEVLQSFSEERLTECPKCGGALQKKLYPVGVIYKGTGFYKTDYNSSSKGSSEKSERASESKSERASESKSERASESKSDTGKSDSSSGSNSDSASDGPKAAAS
jgi:putative FmdB family regulatory protein